jgi:hypothetical protein
MNSNAELLLGNSADSKEAYDAALGYQGEQARSVLEDLQTVSTSLSTPLTLTSQSDTQILLMIQMPPACCATQWLNENPDEPDKQRRASRLMVRISNKCGEFPPSMMLVDVKLQGQPLKIGGFAEVFKGTHK